MAMFIDQVQDSDFKSILTSKDFNLPSQAIEHGVGLDHNPNYNPAVPEPGEYALIFGVLLIVFAIIRKVKSCGRGLMTGYSG